MPVFASDNLSAPFGATAAYSAILLLTGNRPTVPEVFVPLILLLFTLSSQQEALVKEKQNERKLGK